MRSVLGVSDQWRKEGRTKRAERRTGDGDVRGVHKRLTDDLLANVPQPDLPFASWPFSHALDYERTDDEGAHDRLREGEESATRVRLRTQPNELASPSASSSPKNRPPLGNIPPCARNSAVGCVLYILALIGSYGEYSASRDRLPAELPPTS